VVEQLREFERGTRDGPKGKEKALIESRSCNSDSDQMGDNNDAVFIDSVSIAK
jgi:hypothetical protein